MKSVIYSIVLLLICQAAGNAESSPILEDKNQDGIISALAFGDSITFGIGDDSSNGGYPSRLAALVGIPVANQGIPGEQITEEGVHRAPSVLLSSSADLLFLMEGANDANQQKSSGIYRSAVQRIINVAVALGKEPVLFTLPPPCCDRGAQAPFTNSYSSEIKQIAASNSLSIVDQQLAWTTTCEGSECHLYNLPDGLHPNSTGYTVMAQVAAATLLGIDIFAEEGANELEEALALPEGTVIVKPSSEEE